MCIRIPSRIARTESEPARFTYSQLLICVHPPRTPEGGQILRQGVDAAAIAGPVSHIVPPWCPVDPECEDAEAWLVARMGCGCPRMGFIHTDVPFWGREAEYPWRVAEG